MTGGLPFAAQGAALCSDSHPGCRRCRCRGGSAEDACAAVGEEFAVEGVHGERGGVAGAVIEAGEVAALGEEGRDRLFHGPTNVVFGLVEGTAVDAPDEGHVDLKGHGF